MGRLIFTKRASSSTPEAGKVALYAKNDGKLYTKTEDGTESEVGSAGGGGGEPVDYPITVDKGGTGATTVQGALNALTNVAAASAGYVLTKVGSNVAWAAASNGSGSEAGLPNPAGSNANDVVISNGNAQYTLVDDTTFVSAAGAVMKSGFPAKGSLVAGTGAGTTGFLQAGANGKVLAANSAAASGLEWQDRATLTGSTVNAIPKVSGANALAASGVTIDANNFVTFPARIDVNGIAQLKGNAVVTGYLDVAGSISVSGTVDGRDVSVDGVKLDAIKKDNTTATTDPGNANNTSQGYAAGSRWINTSATPAKLFVCTAATSNAATWKEVSRPSDGITKSELTAWGTDITPTGPTQDLKIGSIGTTYRSILVGSEVRSWIALDPTKPPGFNPSMTAAGTNQYARYVRMKDSRGLFVGNAPVTVGAFSLRPNPVALGAGQSLRLLQVAELGSIPFQTGILDLNMQMRGTILRPNTVNASTVPQFRWWLAISQNSATAPTLQISNGQVAPLAGVIASSGIIYSPVTYPADYNNEFIDDLHFDFRLSLDLTYNTNSSLWACHSGGSVFVSNRNESLGSFGIAKIFPPSEVLYTLKQAGISSAGGFSPGDTPRLALYISQSGAAGSSEHGVSLYGRAQDGVFLDPVHMAGHFTPRLVDLENNIATDQYRTSAGALATY